MTKQKNITPFLQKILDGVDVEWKPLGEVSAISRGQRVTKKELDPKKEFPVYSGGVKPMGYYEKSNQNANTITIVKYGTAGFVNFIEENFWANDVCYCIKPTDINNKYLYYFLKAFEFNIKSLATNAIPAHLPTDKINNFEIPIPCPKDPTKSLEIQQKIVAILDKFTELNSALTKELTARKKQYSHYREQLLTFDENEVEWKRLEDIILKSYTGSTPKAGRSEYYSEGKVPWLRTQEVKFLDINETEILITEFAVEDTAVKWIPKDCVIIAISGASAGRSAINKIPLTTNQHCFCLEVDKTKALFRYVFHWVGYNYLKIKSLGRGARGDLNSSIIKNFKIPIPPLAEQERIVNILDKFDTLTTSISEGLPKEIDLRQKQYEYYRDMLFNFPKA